MCYDTSSDNVCFAPEDVAGDLPSGVGDFSMCVGKSLRSLIFALSLAKSHFEKFDILDDLREYIYKNLSTQGIFSKNDQMKRFILEEVISKDVDLMLQNIANDREELLKQLHETPISDFLYPRWAHCYNLGFNFELAVDISGTQPKVDVSGESIRDISLEACKRMYNTLKSFYSRDGRDYSLRIPMGGGAILEIKNPIRLIGSKVFSEPFTKFPKYKCEVEALENPSSGMTIQCEVEILDKNS